MYWNGKAVTSKDLKSQSTTIQLLDLLLKNVGEDVKSSLLPHSSYTKNKTEMIGKITAPLMHFIEEQSGEKLVVRCSGGLSDFSICMEKSSVRMGMIKKIL